jgi:hypothetical protein
MFISPNIRRYIVQIWLLRKQESPHVSLLKNIYEDDDCEKKNASELNHKFNFVKISYFLILKIGHRPIFGLIQYFTKQYVK